MLIDQQPILAHNNGHYYYAHEAISLFLKDSKFKFLHLSSAIKYAKNKTIPCVILNQDGILIKDFSNIHEF